MGDSLSYLILSWYYYASKLCVGKINEFTHFFDLLFANFSVWLYFIHYGY